MNKIVIHIYNTQTNETYPFNSVFWAERFILQNRLKSRHLKVLSTDFEVSESLEKYIQNIANIAKEWHNVRI